MQQEVDLLMEQYRESIRNLTAALNGNGDSLVARLECEFLRDRIREAIQEQS